MRPWDFCASNFEGLKNGGGKRVRLKSARIGLKRGNSAPLIRIGYFLSTETATVWKGKAPLERSQAHATLAPMNLILLILVLLLLFGGGGFYIGGPAIGGGGLGLVLLIVVIIFFMGGWRTKN